MTGFGAFEFSIAGKWVQGLKHLIPSAKQFGVVVNPETAPFYRNFLPFIQKAAEEVGVVPHLTLTDTVDQIVGTIERLARETQGLLVLPGAQFTTNKELILSTVGRLGMPAMYSYTFWVKSGGLISYGADQGRQLPTGGQLCQPHPQGRKASRPARAGADKIRASDQSQDRRGSWPDNPARSARHRRRGHRISR